MVPSRRVSLIWWMDHANHTADALVLRCIEQVLTGKMPVEHPPTTRVAILLRAFFLSRTGKRAAATVVGKVYAGVVQFFQAAHTAQVSLGMQSGGRCLPPQQLRSSGSTTGGAEPCDIGNTYPE